MATFNSSQAAERASRPLTQRISTGRRSNSLSSAAALTCSITAARFQRLSWISEMTAKRIGLFYAPARAKDDDPAARRHLFMAVGRMVLSQHILELTKRNSELLAWCPSMVCERVIKCVGDHLYIA